MSKISTFKFNRNLEYSHRYDYNNYTYYRYSHLLFRSLINRGHKLKAFNFMIALKLQLKLRERVDPNLIILVALLKITPDILVYPLKLGGAVQKVPLAICARKQYTFAVK
jgi:ribosomal protein S7